jgi:pimeloyl-ACP methyl ester carboxylesterase
MFKLPSGVVEGTDVKCGYVTVPEQHSNPDGPSIRLAVVVIPNNSGKTNNDPLFMAQGGPGGSTIETYANQLLTINKFVTDRDIVLFDQRGTLYSKPDLYCSEIDQLIADTIEKDLSDAEDQKLTLAALEKCRQRLIQQDGVDLSDFDSLENSADIEDLRKALGYGQINFYGVSYGTLLGLHYMEMYPKSLRSVILDGVVPPQINFNLNSAQTMNEAFSRLFDACKKDLECNENYPDLENTFFGFIDDLNKNPAKIMLTDSETGKTYNTAVIDGSTFLNGVFQMLYAGSIIPAIPRMIYDARDGNWDFFSRIFSLLIFDRTMSLGMYYSVICAEEADFKPTDQNLAGVRPQIAAEEKDQPEYLLQTCQMWDVRQVAASVDQPITSDIPTLLLSGYFDPITPPSYAEEAAKTLPNSYQFVFPAGGHGQALEGSCANELIQNFLDNPKLKPDSTCVDSQSGPDFITPMNTLDLPVSLKLLNLEPSASRQFIVLAVSLSFLLSAVPVIPAIWLVVAIRRKKKHADVDKQTEAKNSVGVMNEYLDEKQVILKEKYVPLWSKLAGWVAFFAGPLLTAFLIGLTIILFKMAFANDVRLYYGLNASLGWLFILPLIFSGLCLTMFILSLSSWFRQYWKVRTRVYYSLLTASAILCVVVLSIWGMNSILF